MNQLELFKNILDSLKNQIVFADTNHIIRYMNKAAIEQYKEGIELLNSSLLDCHNQKSVKIIFEIFEKMKNGLDEELITDNEKYRVYMKALRNDNDELIGYYERYEIKK
ncbi:MAG: PAS domain-containing protein [Bacteroidales bacterium]